MSLSKKEVFKTPHFVVTVTPKINKKDGEYLDFLIITKGEELKKTHFGVRFLKNEKNGKVIFEKFFLEDRGRLLKQKIEVKNTKTRQTLLLTELPGKNKMKDLKGKIIAKIKFNGQWIPAESKYKLKEVIITEKINKNEISTRRRNK